MQRTLVVLRHQNGVMRISWKQECQEPSSAVEEDCAEKHSCLKRESESPSGQHQAGDSATPGKYTFLSFDVRN